MTVNREPIDLETRLRKGRGYGLGQRNPMTLPGVDPSSETEDQNRDRTRYWSSLRKRVEKGTI